MSDRTDVAIIGAGPYGLSIAAHLASRGVAFRIFGKPMESWLTQMPRDMLLKSEGFASSLFDRAGALTLKSYCREKGLPYADMGLPVPLERFAAYGLAFQQRAVPSLEQTMVTGLKKTPRGFALQLDNGQRLEARRVVMAIGITHFAHMPESLAKLPRERVTHSSEHTEYSRFKGKDVVVLGAGSSAVDVAALLRESGARVKVAARRTEIEVHSKMQLPRPWSDKLRQPMSGIGPSWKSWCFTHLPGVFHHLPEARRLKWTRTHLGPAGGWFMAERFARVPQLLGHTLIDAQVTGDKNGGDKGRVRLEFAALDGSHPVVEADHVIAATGYRPSVKRLTFIDPALARSLAMVNDTPILSSNFQASVAGLYFVGPAAANSFGPVMRFAVGAGFAARRLSRHLAATAQKSDTVVEADRAGVSPGLSSTVGAK